MTTRMKFDPVITRVKLNPEQAVLACTCHRSQYRSGVNNKSRSNICSAYNTRRMTSACNATNTDGNT